MKITTTILPETRSGSFAAALVRELQDGELAQNLGPFHGLLPTASAKTG